MEPEHGLGLRIVEAAHPCDALDARVLVEPGDADQPITGAEREYDLGERRGEGDDPVHLGGNGGAEVLAVRRGDRDREEKSDHWGVSFSATTSLVA
jgi:hypothetical protein